MRVPAHVNADLKTQVHKSISFIAGVWTQDTTTKYFLGLKDHWINKEFNRGQECCTERLSKGNTGTAISDEFLKMLEKWQTAKGSCHAVLHDNGTNI